MKVTITIETDEQTTAVTRQGESNVAQLFAEAIWRVADTFHADHLEFIAKAVADAVQAKHRERSR